MEIPQSFRIWRDSSFNRPLFWTAIRIFVMLQNFCLGNRTAKKNPFDFSNGLEYVFGYNNTFLSRLRASIKMMVVYVLISHCGPKCKIYFFTKKALFSYFPK